MAVHEEKISIHFEENPWEKNLSKTFLTKVKKERNIGVIAHIDSGKTTLTERLLYTSQKIKKLGEVHEGNTTTDFLAQERERGITIVSATISFEYKDHRINLIDSPGHIDFNIEVERCLRVLDGAILVINVKAGPEPQTLTVSNQAKKHKVPLLCFLNKADQEGVFEKVAGDPSICLKELIKKKIHHNPVMMNYPVWHLDEKFYGVVDLFTMEYYCWGKDPTGKTFEILPIPEHIKEKVVSARERLILELVIHDENLYNHYEKGEEISLDDLRKIARKLTISREIMPVFFGSALKNKGIQNIMDGILYYLPAPHEIPPVEVSYVDRNGEVITDEKGDIQTTLVTCDPQGPVTGFVFKTFFMPRTGMVTFVRLYSGTVNKGDSLFNPSTRKEERVSRIVKLDADKINEIEQIQAGDVAGFIIRDSATKTGDTLCSAENRFRMSGITIPETVIAISLETKNKEQAEKLAASVKKMCFDDPSLVFSMNEHGQMILRGMGELHLEVVLSRLKTEYGVEVTAGEPQVDYKATIGNTVAADGIHKKQSGGRGEFAVVNMSFSPAERGQGIVFVSKLTGTNVPSAYVPSVEKGIRAAAKTGIQERFPVIDMVATLLDGQSHAVDSSANAFEIAGKKVFQDAMSKAEIKILEPIMEVDIIVPEEYMGTVMEDVAKRRGKIAETEKDTTNGLGQVNIKAYIPFAEMSGYIGALRSKTQGYCSSTTTFKCYEFVPPANAEKLLQNGEKSPR